MSGGPITYRNLFETLTLTLALFSAASAQEPYDSFADPDASVLDGARLESRSRPSPFRLRITTSESETAEQHQVAADNCLFGKPRPAVGADLG